MISPTAYRFQISDATGTFRTTTTQDASYLLGSNGIRASVTPDLICQEMTMRARNGPVVGNGPGLALNPLDLVTLEVTADGTTYTPVYYGQLRQGGNAYNSLGESMVFRGLDVRLKETATPDRSYASMDGGVQAQALIQDVLTTGRLGKTYTLTAGKLTTPNAIIRYDPAFLPTLGFTAPAILATNQQPLGAFLDQIVVAGAAAGIKVRWGVRPDGYVTMVVARTDELLWPAEQIDWKEPAADVVITSVTWAIERRQDTGKFYYYTSDGPDVPKYGALPTQVQLKGLNPWTPAVLTPTYTGNTSTTPASGNTAVYIRDGDPTSSVTLTDPAVQVSATLTVPAGGAARIYVDASSTSGQVPALIVTNGTNSFFVRANDPGNKAFSKAAFYADAFTIVSGLPAGATAKLVVDPATGGSACTLVIREFRLETLNTAALDAAATAYFRVPTAAPADLYRSGLLLPAEYRGTVRTARPNGAADYTANVSVYEFTLTNAEGVRTAVKTGDPDPPEKTAQATLIKRLASNATANAVMASAT